MAVNVFHHHNRIVYQDAYGEDQRKQGHAVEREAPSPGGEQGGGQRQDDGCAHNHRLASAQRKAHQQDNRAGGKGQFLNQLVGFFGGRFTVVPRDAGFYVGGNHGVAQGVNARAHGTRHIDRVGPGFLGDGQGHRGVHATGGRCLARVSQFRRVCTGNIDCGTRARREPDVALGQLRTRLYARHFAQEHRQAFAHTHHQVTYVLLVAQEFACFHLQQLPGFVAGFA